MTENNKINNTIEENESNDGIKEKKQAMKAGSLGILSFHFAMIIFCLFMIGCGNKAENRVLVTDGGGACLVYSANSIKNWRGTESGVFLKWGIDGRDYEADTMGFENDVAGFDISELNLAKVIMAKIDGGNSESYEISSIIKKGYRIGDRGKALAKRIAMTLTTNEEILEITLPSGQIAKFYLSDFRYCNEKSAQIRAMR